MVPIFLYDACLFEIAEQNPGHLLGVFHGLVVRNLRIYANCV
jgi:hypothetical protein